LGQIDFFNLFTSLAVMLFLLTVHEAAHAWTARRLGDPTAGLLGRISLNPAVHVDPLGTILLPLIAMVTGAPLLGWAKPVPVDFRYLKQPRRDFMVIAAAGPISNLILAVVAAVATGHPLGPGGGIA
jgi:Zn-dependent protease